MHRPNLLSERIVVKITSADILGLLNVFTTRGIHLKNIQYCDELTVHITLGKENYNEIVVEAEKHGAIVKRMHTLGIASFAKQFLKRPVIMTFLLVMFILACYVPGRIFFISVEGNYQVSERYILEVAAECGIDFGASRRMVRSEAIKNRLLQRIPQLQWAGINTYGCTAVISVREKTQTEREKESNYQVSSIVASRDGVIKSCTVYQGNALCTVGQAVTAGQTLVSGYLDYGIVTQTTHADAEISALTYRELYIVSPICTASKGDTQSADTRYGLKIGKKLINFYKDSGNLDATCGKIYSEEYLRLPGGFQLPIAIVKETEIRYDTNKNILPDIEAGEWLKNAAKVHLKNIMISGEIISADAEVSLDKAYHLRGSYICTEMIGKIKYEETIPKDDVKWQNGS